MTSDRETSRLEILCPCCEATILVDRATGIIISHEARKDLKGFRVLHLATHGEANEGRPAETALVVSASNGVAPPVFAEAAPRGA